MRIAKRLAIGFCFGLIMLALAGAESGDSTVYIKTVNIDQIASVKLGYKVWYTTGSGEHAITYLPIKWFYGTAGKGQLVQVWDASSPYLEVIFKENNFWYVRLHVVPSKSDPSWTVVSASENIDDQFNIESPIVKY